MSTTVIQHGLERTGTHLAAWMLEKHTNGWCDVNRFGFKHGPYQPAQVAERLSRAPVLVTVRHPVSWLVSVHAFRVKKDDVTQDFAGWIQSGGPLHPREVRMWTFAYGYWARRLDRWQTWDGRPCAAIRLEDMLRAPADTLRGVADKLDLNITAEIEAPEDYQGENYGGRADGFARIRGREVERQTWREEAADVWGPLSRAMDHDVLDYWGYAMSGELI